MFANIFKNKTVLITGHTGFKGTWLSFWLKKLGANVIGVSKDIPSSPSHFKESNLDEYLSDHRMNICNNEDVRNLLLKNKPDFIFHLAAQALVQESYQNPMETIKTNALGTASLLDALRYVKKPTVAVMITSDKAYDNVEWVWGYRETDKLGGADPYSASKGMAEFAIRTYVESFFLNQDIKIGIARAGNVIGGGDWAKNRIVPDCIKSWAVNEIVEIRSPDATRPWQHVLEPLSGYLWLAANLYKTDKLHGEAYNFGPISTQDYSVSDLINEMKKSWENVQWSDQSTINDLPKEAGLLKLNCDKALSDLNWKPTLSFEETVNLTVEWYKNFYTNKKISVSEMTNAQISTYENLAIERGLSWSN